jgi:monomeric isocitrate dehydrogenase
MSTLAAVEILKRLEIKKYPIRRMAVYKVPEKLRPPKSTIQTSNKIQFTYETDIFGISELGSSLTLMDAPV